MPKTQSDVDYLLVDADQHYYEPDDCFTRHIEPTYRDAAIEVVRGKSRFAQVHFRGKRIGFFSAPPGEVAGKPGSLKAFFVDGKGDHALTAGDTIHSYDFPESMDRNRRMSLLDTQGVEAGIILPSLGVGIEMEMRSEPEVLHANLRAFNRYVAEDWGWDYENRIFSVPLLSLADLDLAVSELDRVLAEGARIVHLTPAPINGRSPADPCFDPFWARCEEAGVPVAFHLGNAGMEALYTAAWSENPNPQHHRLSAFQRTVGFAERAINDTMAALILHNLFGRFPLLRVVSIENGSRWIHSLLKKMDSAIKMTTDRDYTFGPLTDLPSALFARHVFVSPYPEDNLRALADTIGVSQILFGSDWPHPEGLHEPREFVEKLEGFSEVEIRRIMRENSAELLGLA